MSPHHREALGHLLYGTGEDGGFVQITGEVGTGKTTLIRTLLEQNMPDVDVALILNPRLNVVEFLAAICDELRVANPRPGASLKQLVDALNAHLLSSHAKGRRTVLIVDEAQHLNHDVLEQVRLLTNLETHRHKLLRIMLVGQPELRELLDRKDLRQLAQRITARYHLDSLNPAQTREYVLHRLQVAGGRPGIFSRAALNDIYRLTKGTPRLINVICDRALLGAYGQGQPQVSKKILRQAANEVFNKRGARHSIQGGPALWPWLAMFGASVALGVSLFLAQPLLDRKFSSASAEANANAQAQVAKPESEPPVQVPPSPEPAAAPVEPEAPAWLLTQDAAFAQLAGLWDVSGKARCEDLSSRGLRCEAGEGNWAQLRGFNLPVILTLQSNGERGYALVRRLEGGEAILVAESGEARESLATLSEQWTGAWQLIWQPQINTSSIGPDSEQSAIRWLLKRLSMAEGSDPGIVSLPYRYDAALRERVRRFQERQELIADGLVGPHTMIHLNALAPEAGTPVLVGKGAA